MSTTGNSTSYASASLRPRDSTRRRLGWSANVRFAVWGIPFTDLRKGSWQKSDKGSGPRSYVCPPKHLLGRE